VTTRKRWSEVYADDNPLALPQAIKRELKACCKDGLKERIQFLWIIFGSETADQPPLDSDHWLNVIDEAAAVGVQTLVITLESPLSEQGAVWKLCEWAIKTHDMLVGIHLREPTIDAGDIEQIVSFYPGNFCLFVHSSERESVDKVLGGRVRIIDADGLEDGAAQNRCTLPSKMTCVSGGGGLYTCGLVLGHDGFYLGDVNDVRIDHVIEDNKVPHYVPENTSQDSHRCDGCPPLLEERMRKAFD
jgi:hypothetical protein